MTTLSRDAGEDIGSYAITATAVPNPNYVIETVPGTLTIEPRPVTVTAGNKTKVYGTADPELTATVRGLADGDSRGLISYNLERVAGEDVGTYAINATGEAAQGNYTVTYVPGALTIVPENTVVVTITGNSGSFQYDGTEKDLSGYTVTINNPLYTETDFTFSGSNELKGTNAGEYRTEMKAENFRNTNTNFTNVVFQVENGELLISKGNVTLTSADATKPYDGTALTNRRVDISGDGFAEGEGVTLNVTGRITQVGSTENTFTYTMADGTLAGNYSIRSVFGTLTITASLTHRLTITYVNDKGEILKVFTRSYATGEVYSVITDPIPGYRADIEKVTGTMGNEDIEVVVTYTPVSYRLTVNFIDVTDGKPLANPVVLELKGGDTYAVFVPRVAGYTSQVKEVTGTMPNRDRTVTVLMTPEGANGRTGGGTGGNQIPDDGIGDYGTPLGVADSILGGGEIIE